MIKVHILDKCPHCRGQAQLSVGEGKDYKGRTYTRYVPCPDCEGSGNQARWISLQEFAELLHQAVCQHEHVSAQGGMHFSAGDVWDNLELHRRLCIGGTGVGMLKFFLNSNHQWLWLFSLSYRDQSD